MAHAHTHDDSDSYYPEQLCLIAFSGLFGGICLSLYFWQTDMLKLVLAEKFHPFVLVSGIALLGLTLLRAAVVWKLAGETRQHTHEHDCSQHHHHEHDCGHDHHHDHAGDCGHDHHHEHGGDCGHQHEQACGHTQAHSHAHDHEHGWAPWRYMILLVPVILYLLGLPNKLPDVGASNIQVQGAFTKEATGYGALVAAGPTQWSQLAAWLAVSNDPTAGPVSKIDFLTLEQAAFVGRDAWEGKAVRVLGQYQRSVHSLREFSLMRLKIECCGADAIPLQVPMISKEPITSIQPMQWVEVTGKVEFHKQGNKYVTVLRVPGRSHVKPTEPDANPYIQ
jgi:hypothetical protein